MLLSVGLQLPLFLVHPDISCYMQVCTAPQGHFDRGSTYILELLTAVIPDDCRCSVASVQCGIQMLNVNVSKSQALKQLSMALRWQLLCKVIVTAGLVLGVCYPAGSGLDAGSMTLYSCLRRGKSRICCH